MPQSNRPAVIAMPKATYTPNALAQRVRPGKAPQTPEIDAATTEWFAMAVRIGQNIDLDQCANGSGLMARYHDIPTTGALLAVALLYGPGGLSLRQLVESLRRLALVSVKEPALLRCLHGSTAWLESVAEQMIIEQLLQRDAEAAPQEGALTLRSYADWHHASQTAKHFLLDFMPWHPGVFTLAQEQWLLSARWNFVAATLNAAHSTREAGYGEAPTMERVRMLAHLIAAVMPEHSN